jgi:hypothetical protein
MASPITRIRDAVSEYLNAAYVDVYPAGIPMPFGKLERDKHADAPRVTWVPSNGADAPATKLSGENNPRSLGTVVQRMKIQVWGRHPTDDAGDHFGATWDLLMQVRRAVYLAAHGSMKFQGHRPLTEDELAAHDHRGHAWELAVDFFIPIVDAAVPETVVTGVGHTTHVEGSAEVGCQS